MRHKITLPAAENGRYIFAVSFFKNPVSSLEQKRPEGEPYGTNTNFDMIFMPSQETGMVPPVFHRIRG